MHVLMTSSTRRRPVDQKKLQKQARILRNKRLASRAARKTTTVAKGVVRVDAPVSKKPKDNSRLAPPSKAEIRRARHERVLAQRKELLQRKGTKSPVKSRGCAGCHRKIGGK